MRYMPFATVAARWDLDFEPNNKRGGAAHKTASSHSMPIFCRDCSLSVCDGNFEIGAVKDLPGYGYNYEINKLEKRASESRNPQRSKYDYDWLRGTLISCRGNKPWVPSSSPRSRAAHADIARDGYSPNPCGVLRPSTHVTCSSCSHIVVEGSLCLRTMSSGTAADVIASEPQRPSTSVTCI